MGHYDRDDEWGDSDINWRKVILVGAVAVAALAVVAIATIAFVRPAGAADISTKDSPYQRGVITSTAQPSSTWSAIWISALAGYSMSNTDLRLDVLTKNEDETASFREAARVDGFGGEGWDGTVQLGGDAQIGRLVVGGWGEYSFGGTESTVSIARAVRLDVEQQDSYGLFGRVGLAHGDTLFYGAGGWVWTEFDATLRAGSERARETFEFDGPAAEIGMEHRFGPNVRGKLSARYTWLEEETVLGGGDEDFARLTAEPGVWSVKAGVVISTGNLGLGIFSGN